MDNSQILTIALAAVPNMLAVLAGILINNARLSDTNARIRELRGHMDSLFNAADRRFDEMRDLLCHLPDQGSGADAGVRPTQ
jgi:hypothetical protein